MVRSRRQRPHHCLVICPHKYLGVFGARRPCGAVALPLAAQVGRRRCLVDPACLAGLLLRPRVSHAQRVEGTSYPQRSGCEVRAPPPIGGGRPPIDPAGWLAQCRRLQRGCARPSRDSTPCRPQRGTVGYAVIFTAKGIHPDRSGEPAGSSLLAGTVPSSSARSAHSPRGEVPRSRSRGIGAPVVLGLGVEFKYWGWELRSVAEAIEASPGKSGAPDPMGTAAEPGVGSVGGCRPLGWCERPLYNNDISDGCIQVCI